MLTIKPIEDKKIQEELCDLCGVEYKADALAYSCYEAQTFVGVCQFTLKGTAVYLLDLAVRTGTSDVGALFIMGRSALNFADLAGFHDAYYPDPADAKLAAMIGFKRDDGDKWYMDLRGFFEGGCSCSCDKK